MDSNNNHQRHASPAPVTDLAAYRAERDRTRESQAELYAAYERASELLDAAQAPGYPSARAMFRAYTADAVAFLDPEPEAEL